MFAWRASSAPQAWSLPLEALLLTLLLWWMQLRNDLETQRSEQEEREPLGGARGPKALTFSPSVDLWSAPTPSLRQSDRSGTTASSPTKLMTPSGLGYLCITPPLCLSSGFILVWLHLHCDAASRVTHWHLLCWLPPERRGGLLCPPLWSTERDPVLGD